MTDFQLIREAIEKMMVLGEKKVAIFPYGELGFLTKKILNDGFGMQENLILDNDFCKTNKNIKPLDYLAEIDMSEFVILYTAANSEIRTELKNKLLKYCEEEQIVEIFPERNLDLKTKCGKYSYGPLCNHPLVKEVGAFCSFAIGVDVVSNHPMKYISTAHFLYMSEDDNKYDDYSDCEWYFEGVHPHGEMHKFGKTEIGNDVWLGKNVVITNGANIGNGVIAGAGAVITKDVPDYAVVVGAPARVIRYRYTQEQIQKLNQIAWWNWSDEKIRECYEDFYLDVDEFIRKYE